MTSVHKQSEAVKEYPSPIVPQFFQDEQALRDAPIIPKLNLEKIQPLNFCDMALIRQASNSLEYNTSFGDDSKS